MPVGITITTAGTAIAASSTLIVNRSSLATSSANLEIDGNSDIFRNYGTLVGAHAVYTTNAAYIYNAGTGVIQGFDTNAGAIDFGNSSDLVGGTVVNKGQILGGGANGSVGIQMYGAGSVNNSGTITNSIWSYKNFLSITNSGEITGSATYAAIYAGLGAIVTNTASGIISSGSRGYGIQIGGGAGTVVNAGQISASGTAVQMEAGYANRLIVNPGATFSGIVDGGANTIVDGSESPLVASGTTKATLELTSGTPGTIGGLGTQFIDFQTDTIDTGATWNFTGTNSLATGTTLANSGTVVITGSLTAAGIVSGAGTLAFGSNAGEILRVANPNGVFANKIDNFATDGTLSIIFAAGTSVSSLAISGSTLTVTPSQGVADKFILTGTYGHTNLDFSFSNAGSIATITDNVPCFLAGTRIRTERGEVLVEYLKIGDKVVTLDGTAKPVKWIGRRAYSSAFASGNRDVLPVLIKQGALGRNVPYRDLYVSPLHAMFFDDVLVQAGHLVNGESIVRCPDIDPIRYFHIELEQHDIVFAEGAPSETYVDCDSRGMFHNAREFDELYPDALPQRWLFCAPRIESGPILEQIRRVIDVRAGLAAPGAEVAPGPLEGNLDGLDGNTIIGWAFDPKHPDSPVTLEVLDGDGLVARLTANRFRGDLEAACIGDGRHGFELPLSRALSPLIRHELRVRRVADGRELAGSPLIIEPHDRRTLVKDTRRAIDLAANTAGDPGTLDALLDTLLEGVDQIRRLRATQEPETGDDRLLSRAKPARLRPKRALVIDDLLPRRDRDAGSNAILSHIAALRTLGWDVDFVASGELSRGDDAAEALKAWGVVCHRAPRIASVEEVFRRKRNMYDLVYMHRLSNAEAYAWLSRTWQPKARVVYGLADLHHIRSARQAIVHDNQELAKASVFLKARELNAMRMADAVITHSVAEAAYLAREAPSIRVHVVPWAVRSATTAVPLRKRHGIAFVGGMRHAPNPDAVRWLAADVMPRVWERDPHMQVMLVGADWSPAVWGRSDPRLHLAGQVEHLRDVFAQVRLTVAPLRFGAGIKGKVLDSFAAGLPCVMTSIAAEGIPLDRTLRAAVTDDPAAMADLICDVHYQTRLNNRLAKAGRALIESVYTEDAITAALETVVGIGTPRSSVRLIAAA